MKSLVIFDGDCGFCKRCVDRWQQAAGPLLEFKPYQEVASLFSQIPVSAFEQAVHLIEGSKVTSGAEAVFRIREICGKKNFYTLAPKIFEAGYRFVSRNRPLFSKVDCIF